MFKDDTKKIRDHFTIDIKHIIPYSVSKICITVVLTPLSRIEIIVHTDKISLCIAAAVYIADIDIIFEVVVF